MKQVLVPLLCISLALGAIPPGTPQTSQGSTWFPCVMTRYSTPLKLGFVLGISKNYLQGRQQFHGPFFQLEPGFGGGKINIGYKTGAFDFLPVYNIGLSGSLLHTWGNPLGDIEPNQTYAGLELSGALYMLQVNSGIFHHIAGDDNQHNWIITIGAGVGF